MKILTGLLFSRLERNFNMNLNKKTFVNLSNKRIIFLLVIKLVRQLFYVLSI